MAKLLIATPVTLSPQVAQAVNPECPLTIIGSQVKLTDLTENACDGTLLEKTTEDAREIVVSLISSLETNCNANTVGAGRVNSTFAVTPPPEEVPISDATFFHVPTPEPDLNFHDFDKLVPKGQTLPSQVRLNGISIETNAYMHLMQRPGSSTIDNGEWLECLADQANTAVIASDGDCETTYSYSLRRGLTDDKGNDLPPIMISTIQVSCSRYIPLKIYNETVQASTAAQ